MAFAVSAEALLLSDTGLYDLEKKSTEVSAKKKTMSDMLSKSELWTFLKVESFIKKTHSHDLEYNSFRYH